MSGTVVGRAGTSRLAVLVRESSNRVFGASAAALLAAEVEAIAPHFSGATSNIDIASMGGLSYVLFDLEAVTSLDVFLASNLALGRGLFEIRSDGSLYPLPSTPLAFFGTDLVTIQRYVGKTNEQFTHLLMNLTLSASGAAHERALAGDKVRLLDPVAGRGSTLNRGLTYGFHVAGVELEESSVDHYRQFLISYLKDHRVKHKATTERIRKGEQAGASAFEVDIRPASASEHQHVRVVRTSTANTAGLLGSRRFEVIAGDLPYGLAHRAKGQKVDRSPGDLVHDSLPGWKSLLAPRGALGLSWNVKTLPRKELAAILETAGLDVVEHPRSFEHRVDRQIVRDVIVARKG